MLRVILILGICSQPALAESLIATRIIRAQTIINAQDVTLVDAEVAGALDHPSLAIGKEARVIIYPGRPVRQQDIGAPAIVDRNQIVRLAYALAGLEITTEGRSLSRGGVGDLIRVMNLSSRSIVEGEVAANGRIVVGTQAGRN